MLRFFYKAVISGLLLFALVVHHLPNLYPHLNDFAYLTILATVIAFVIDIWTD